MYLFPAIAALFVAQPPAADRARELERDALISYGFALVQQRDDRLVTAAAQLEEAIRLDPQALPPRVALVPLLSALGRTEEAMTAASAVLAIDAGQSATARWLAQMQVEQGRLTEAADTLRNCAATTHDRPAELAAIHRQLGAILELEKKTDAASQAYRQALDLLTDGRERVELLIAVGRTMRDPKQFEVARDAARRLGIPPALLRIDYHLAAMLVERGELRAADATLNHYLAARTRDLQAFELKVRLARQSDDNSVFEALETVARRDPECTPLVVLLGNEYRHRGDWPKAEAAFLSVVAREPNIDAYRGLLNGYGTNDVARALALVNSRLSAGRLDPPGVRGDHARAILAALRQEPALARSLIAAADGAVRGDPSGASGDSWRLWANVALHSGLPAEAERMFLAALKRGDRDAEFAIVDGLLQSLEQQRKWLQIIDACRQCLEAGRAPRPEYYWRSTSHALMRLDRIDEALAAADRGIASARDANLDHLRLQRIQVLMYGERYADAQAAIAALLTETRLFATQRNAQLVQARLSALTGQPERAEAILRGIVAQSPDDSRGLLELGLLLVQDNRLLPEAERLCRRALELDRRGKKDSLDDEGPSARYLGGLGWALVRLGRTSEGRSWLEQAAGRLDGAQDAGIWDRLGDACWRLGDRPAAALAWSKARECAGLDKRSLRDPRLRHIEQKLQQGLSTTR